MSTRSMIAFDNGDEIYSIYCHFDGYLSHNGKILFENYTDIDKVEQLMDLGDLSALGPDIGEKQDFNNRTDDNWCLAYGRDRGETGVDAKKFDSIQELKNYYNGSWCEYLYLFDGSEWSVLRGKEFVKLTKEMVDEGD